MRRPDRVEKQFTAHGGPIFALDWHPEVKTWIATAGRDKTIKVGVRNHRGEVTKIAITQAGKSAESFSGIITAFFSSRLCTILDMPIKQ